MSSNHINAIDGLLRYHGDNQGIVQTTVITLRALIDSLQAFDAPGANPRQVYDELRTALKRIRPLIIPLLNMVESFGIEMDQFWQEDPARLKQHAIALLSKMLTDYEEKTTRLIEQGARHINDQDRVMVHMASHVVTNILIRAKTQLGKRFKTIILQQHLMRARQLIRALTQAKIHHVITPNYDVGHYLKKASKLFIAAVCVTRDGKAMVPIGAMNILCACQHSNIPVYLFVNTSHLTDKLSENLHVCAQKERLGEDEYRYFLTSHSHDIVDLGLFDHIITEHGEAPDFLAILPKQDIS